MSVTFKTKKLIDELEKEMLDAYRKNAGIRSRIEKLQKKLKDEKDKLKTALDEEIKIASKAKYKDVSSLVESNEWKKDLQDAADKLYKKAQRARAKTSKSASTFAKDAKQKIEALKEAFEHHNNVDLQTKQLKETLIELKKCAASVNLTAWLKSCKLPARATRKGKSNKEGTTYVYEHMPWD